MQSTRITEVKLSSGKKNLLKSLSCSHFCHSYKKETNNKITNQPRPFGQRLASGPPECQEGAPSLDPDRENSTEEGGGAVSVSNVLSGSGTVSVTLWGGDLGFIGGNFQESGRGACGVPQTGDEKYGQVAGRRGLEKRGSRECTQRSGNIDTGEVH